MYFSWFILYERFYTSYLQGYDIFTMLLIKLGNLHIFSCKPMLPEFVKILLSRRHEFFKVYKNNYNPVKKNHFSNS